MRVLYLVEAVLSRRDFERFGLGFMLSEGFDVSVVDVTNVSQPRLPKNRDHYDGFDGIDIHVARNGDDLKAIRDVRDGADVIISAIGSTGVTPENIQVHRWLSGAKAKIVKVHCDSYPGIDRMRGDVQHLPERIQDISRRLRQGQISPARSLMARMPRQWLGVRPVDYVIYGGRVSRSVSRYMHPMAQEIWAHSFDYEVFRGIRERSIDGADTAVFIDEYLPYHPDLATRGQSAPVAPDRYFASVRRFFDQVEVQTGLRVLIAACPRADYSDKPGIFGDRDVVFAKTGELIAQSKLVLAHRSTAIGFAVMLRKPVTLFALRDTLDHVNHRIPTLAYAEALNRPVHLVGDDRTALPSDLMSFDDGVYNKFMANYVKTPESLDAPLWRIVIDQIGLH